MIDLALLGVLKERPLHGYELKKRLGELLGPHLSLSFGTLYPALAKLERAGEVRTVDADEPAGVPPMTGSIAGELAAFRARRRPRLDRRGRKVYAITDRGERRFRELFDGDLDDRTFPLAVAFCRFLPPERRAALFQRRRAAVSARLADTEAATAAAGGSSDRYCRALLQHRIDTLRADIAWLDGLIEDERQGEPTPTGGNHR